MAEKETIRIGKISSFNYPDGTARVTYEDKDGSTTVEMPFLAWEYWMPKVGDQVVVAHLSNGTSAAVILGPFWYDGNRPVEGFEGLYRKEYANEKGLANERYDAAEQAYSQTVTGTMTITSSQTWMVKVGGCTLILNPDGTAQLIAPGGFTVSGDVKVNGQVTATGDVLATNSVSLANHTHTGNLGSPTSKPN